MPFAYAKATPVTLRSRPSRPAPSPSFAAQSVVIRTNFKTRNERNEEIRKRQSGLRHRGSDEEMKNGNEDKHHFRGIRRVALIQTVA